MSLVQGHFRPEFLNRVDEFIVFNRLDKEELAQIVQLQVKRVSRRLDEKKIHMDVSPAAVARLAELGYERRLMVLMDELLLVVERGILVHVI